MCYFSSQTKTADHLPKANSQYKITVIGIPQSLEALPKVML